MKTLYIDCSMGAAGDMLTAALLELMPDKDAFVAELNSLGIPSVVFSAAAAVKCGITGTGMTVKIHGEEEGEAEPEHHHHNHSGMHEISHIIARINVSERVRADVLAVYRLIAQAESKAHGVPVTEIHFHEVGMMDAVADITAVCLLMERLSPERVVVSPIHVGSGTVKCAHGILPVPAPATAHILQGVPIYGGKILGELCTPTGAALLRHFATSFGEMPIMTVDALGYGMGKKDFDAANCVRVMLGNTADSGSTVVELCCNVDDMTAEQIGFASERLLEAGALEVFTTAVGMKKSRPGTLITVLCGEEKKDTVIKSIFLHTTTIGIREKLCGRHTLLRSVTTLQTPYGAVRRKDSVGYGVVRSKLEFEDLARIARNEGISLEAAAQLAVQPSGMTKEAVADFFNKLAPHWDDEQEIDSGKIDRILDAAGVKEGVSVLDVACGTGILFDFYLNRNVGGVLGVDISPEMIGIAREKHADPRIELICADVETAEITRNFDCCVVFNAFPHFPEPKRLIERLAGLLKPGGRLTVAHSMGVHALNHHHAGAAARVSRGMISAEEMTELFSGRFDVDTAVAEDDRFIVSGVLK